MHQIKSTTRRFAPMALALAPLAILVSSPQAHAQVQSSPTSSVQKKIEAVDDEAFGLRGEQITIDVLANDKNADPETLVLLDASDGVLTLASGTFEIKDGKLVYTSAEGFLGTTSVSYMVSQSQKDGAPASGASVEIMIGRTLPGQAEPSLPSNDAVSRTLPSNSASSSTSTVSPSASPEPDPDDTVPSSSSNPEPPENTSSTASSQSNPAPTGTSSSTGASPSTTSDLVTPATPAEADQLDDDESSLPFNPAWLALGALGALALGAILWNARRNQQGSNDLNEEVFHNRAQDESFTQDQAPQREDGDLGPPGGWRDEEGYRRW